MATNDVPGAVASNQDDLHVGCWAEHPDGSLLFVEGTEGGTIVYLVFDMSQKPPVQYRDGMPEKGFKDHFQWINKKARSGDKWIWHDKTDFPWNKVIKQGAKDGVDYVCADDLISAAQRVAESRALIRKGKPVRPDDYSHMVPKLTAAAKEIRDGIQRAIDTLESNDSDGS